jgi:structure-specific recognition protein 1
LPFFWTEIRVANSGLAWKALEGDATATVAAANIKWAQWIRVARNFQLRIGLKDNRRRETFDGFEREVRESQPHHLVPLSDFPQDQEKLANLFKAYFDVALEIKETSFKGWNWGVTDFQGKRNQAR